MSRNNGLEAASDMLPAGWACVIVVALVGCAPKADGGSVGGAGSSSLGGAESIAAAGAGGGPDAGASGASEGDSGGNPVLGGAAGLDGGTIDEPGPGAADASPPFVADDPKPRACPVAAPVPVLGQLFSLVRVDASAAVVTIRNTSESTQQLTRDAQLCDAPWCVFLGDAPTVFSAGAERSFDISQNEHLEYRLSPERGELSLHDGVALGDPTTVRAYLAWGSGGSGGPDGEGQEPFAVAAGLWVAGERAEFSAADSGLIAIGPSDRGRGYSAVSSDCP